MKLTFSITACFLVFGLVACGSESTGDQSAPADPAPPSGEALVAHGCDIDNAADFGGQATVDLAWAMPHNNCIIVDEGTVVEFTGNFNTHPLAGGISPTRDDESMLTQMPQGGDVAAISMDAAGDYAYFCEIHAAAMQGVIYVR